MRIENVYPTSSRMSFLEGRHYKRANFTSRKSLVNLVKTFLLLVTICNFSVYIFDKYISELTISNFSVLVVTISIGFIKVAMDLFWGRMRYVEYSFVFLPTAIECRDGINGSIKYLFSVPAIEEVIVVPAVKTFRFADLEFRPTRSRVKVKYAGEWIEISYNLTYAEAIFIADKVCAIAELKRSSIFHHSPEEPPIKSLSTFGSNEIIDAEEASGAFYEIEENGFRAQHYPSRLNYTSIFSSLFLAAMVTFGLSGLLEPPIFSSPLYYLAVSVPLVDLFGALCRALATLSTRHSVSYDGTSLKILAKSIRGTFERSLDLKNIKAVNVEVDNPANILSRSDAKRHDFSVVIDYGSNTIRLCSQYNYPEANFLRKRIRSFLPNVEAV